MLQPIKKLLKLNNEKHNFHAVTNTFSNENLTPMNETIGYNCRNVKRSGLIHACCSRNGIVYIKENESSRPVKVFHLVKLISLFLDHFRKQWWIWSISWCVNKCKQFVAIIISMWSFQLALMKCWYVVNQLLLIN